MPAVYVVSRENSSGQGTPRCGCLDGGLLCARSPGVRLFVTAPQKRVEPRLSRGGAQPDYLPDEPRRAVDVTGETDYLTVSVFSAVMAPRGLMQTEPLASFAPNFRPSPVSAVTAASNVSAAGSGVTPWT